MASSFDGRGAWGHCCIVFMALLGMKSADAYIERLVDIMQRFWSHGRSWIDDVLKKMCL
jgi:hypothetical protein